MITARTVLVAMTTLASLCAAAEPSVKSTQVIGPFSGADAAIHPANLGPIAIEYYGTDLGFTYVHEGQLRILFGDSWAVEAYAPIEASSGSRFDDAFGTIDLQRWPDGRNISPDNIPLIHLGQNPGTSEASAIDPGHAMDLGKTPMAGFSNGIDEFGIFNITKPQGCSNDGDCDNGLDCDTGLGYLGTRYFEEENLTLPCAEGMPFCAADTMVDADGKPVPASGFCVDTGSTAWADTPSGRLGGVGLRQRVGLRDKQVPKQYATIHEWLTNRFVNFTATTVQSFVPGSSADYRPAGAAGKYRRVLLWGRPGFIGVGASARSLGLYFAWVDMPIAPDYEWQVNYYSGEKNGVPRFSQNESDAVPLDLDSGAPGNQPEEPLDIVHQMSVEWIAPLGKWVMFYGGGITDLPSAVLPDCGVLQLFTNYECKKVVIGNGAIRMRSADNPWGPWTPPRDVIVGGNPAQAGSGQYGEGGVLNHPDCTADTCAPHTRTPAYHDNEYGFFYSANIVVPWITTDGDDVTIFWNASTWDPYRVVLLETTLAP